MSRVKDKRLRKLRKRRIWPSVAMFFIFIIISLVVITVFFSMFIFNIIQSKYNDSFNESDKLTSSALSLRENGYDWDKIIAFIKTTGMADSAAVTDSSYSVLASYGDLTFDSKPENRVDINRLMNTFMEAETGTVEHEGLRMVLPDKEYLGEDGIIDEEEMSFGLHLEKIMFTALMGSEDGENGVSGQNEKIYSMNYWLSSPIGDTGANLVTKCSMHVYRSEIYIIQSVCKIALVILCVPMVVLLINVITNLFSQRRMRTLLYTDSITGGKSWLFVQHNAKEYITGKGLLSRLGFMREDSRAVAVVDMSLQKYRSYCTCHGAEAGETLLENIDKQINKMIYKREVCARVEKADFVLIVRGKDAAELKNRVYELTAKVKTGVEAHHMTWHAGIYMYDGSTSDINLMYNYAGAARASLSNTEDTKVALFDQQMLEQQIWEHKVEERMEEALQNEEFRVYLQPKYDPVTERLSGAEALIRWISPQDGFISPGKFIPIFEKNGFITKIDDYMLSHTAAQQAKWIAEGKPVVPVSVNISRAHFAQPGLAEHIRALVDQYGIPHDVIEIELTESAFFDDKQALLDTVNRLKEYGFDISMDDFGAGYSSLNSLKDLPLDVLKLDAEFFRGNAEKKRSETVVSEAIKLAKCLDMRIVAEGVEKKEQVDFLAGQGCDMIQGFYFAKPMPIDEFEKKHWHEEVMS